MDQQQPITSFSIPNGPEQQASVAFREQPQYLEGVIRCDLIDGVVGNTFHATDSIRRQLEVSALANARLEEARSAKDQAMVNRYGSVASAGMLAQQPLSPRPTSVTPLAEKLQTIDSLGYNRELDIYNEQPDTSRIWTEALQAGALDADTEAETEAEPAHTPIEEAANYYSKQFDLEDPLIAPDDMPMPAELTEQEQMYADAMARINSIHGASA